MRMTGPIEHNGLAVYYLHDESRGGPVPLTLKEALLKGDFHVGETGDVHELTIENAGDEPVFIQAGDIVKGGWQDRVLGVSMLVPARSGKVPIAAFCVESGRWSRRGFEDAGRFSTSDNHYASPRAKKAMRVSAASYDVAAQKYATRSYSSLQREVWNEVDRTQTSLSTHFGATVRAAASPTSLELSIQDESVQAARASFETRLSSDALADPSITGAVFAVNGEIRHADTYPWSGLFRKMWSKNLGASITEALRAGASTVARAPSPEAAGRFLAEPEVATATEHALPLGARLRQRVTARVACLEALAGDGTWVHRSYVAEGGRPV